MYRIMSDDLFGPLIALILLMLSCAFILAFVTWPTPSNHYSNIISTHTVTVTDTR